MSASNVNISFELTGPSQADADTNLAPILFLHGLACCKETWKKVLKPIANATGRRVGSFDARNHGDSGWSDDYSYESMMSDLTKIMEFLHIEKAILVGHCMGGKTAIEFAMKHPEKVEKLIVEDMNLHYQPPGEREYTLKYMDLLKESLKHIPSEIKDLTNAQKFLATYLHQNMPEELRSEHHSELEPYLMSIEKDGVTQNIEWKYHLNLLEFAVLNGFQTEPDVGGFRMFKYEGEYTGPALFLFGTRSPYKINEDKDFILKSLTKATFRPVEGAGHNVHIDYPDLFCEEVIKFVNNDE